MKIAYFELHPDFYYRSAEAGKDVRNGRDWELKDGFLCKGNRRIPISNVAWFDVQEETHSSRPQERPPEAAVARPADPSPPPVPAKRKPGRPPNRTPS